MRGHRPLLAAIAALVLGCGGADPAHYTEVLDELSVPPSWNLIHTTVMRSGGVDKAVDPSRSQDDIACDVGPCPAVIRYYLVAAQPRDAYPSARQMVLDAGFEITSETGPTCDQPVGMAACELNGVKGGDGLQVTFYNPGQGSAGVGMSDPKQSLIRVMARLKGS